MTRELDRRREAEGAIAEAPRPRGRQVSLRAVLGGMIVIGLILGLCVSIQRRHDAIVIERQLLWYESVVAEFQRYDYTSTSVRVVGANSGEPISNVQVKLTLIGPDGGDGGYSVGLTDRRGVMRIRGRLTPGRYQYRLMKPKDARMVTKSWRGEPYLKVLPQGQLQRAVLLWPE